MGIGAASLLSVENDRHRPVVQELDLQLRRENLV